MNSFARVTSCFLWNGGKKKVARCFRQTPYYLMRKIYGEMRDCKLSITVLHSKKVVRFEVYVTWAPNNKPLIIYRKLGFLSACEKEEVCT